MIITDNPVQYFDEEKNVIITEFAGSFSWLANQLKNIYVNEIKYSIDDDFFSEISNVLIKTFENEIPELLDIMDYIIHELEST